MMKRGSGWRRFPIAASILRRCLCLLLSLALALPLAPLMAAASGGGNLSWPLDPAASSFLQAVESDFGFRGVAHGTTYHFAFDAGSTKGDAVNTVAAGKVVWTGCPNPIRAVVVEHPGLGISTLYMHLSKISVKVGDELNAGDKVGEIGPDNTASYPYHLDMRVVKGGGIPAGWTETKDKKGNVIGWSCPVGSASQYDNPARWFKSLDTGAATDVEAMQVRVGTSGGYKSAESLYKTDSNGNKYIEIDEDDIWVRLKVNHNDKDMEEVRAVLQLNGGGETELHKFDYYVGTSSANSTMPLRLGNAALTATDKGYVNTQGVSKGSPAKDIFYAQVKTGDVPTDGKIHKVAFHVKDVFDNEVDISKTQVPVKRKGTYKVEVKPDKDEYICCASPTFTVEVRDAQAEGNPLIDIDDEKEKIEAKFMGKDATLSKSGKGTYKATTSEQMRDSGSFPLTVKITRKKDGKNLGTGAGSAKAKRPPQEYYTDRCGRRRPKVWNPRTCQWEIPPGNQPCQPDDNESVMTGDFSPVPDEAGQTRIAVMEGGFAYTLADMLRRTGVAVDLVPQEFSPTIVQQYPALFVASGAFAGLGQSDLMAERLARYTEAGGTLVVFTQPQGGQFGLLPGGEVEGYGYDEDLFCVYKSAAISSFGPQLTGQTEEVLSLNIDGFFTHTPAGATVLLRRTLTGMPAMFTYAYGNGRVLATTTYADMAEQLGQGTPSESVLVRDLATWSLNPTANPPRTGVGGSVSITAKLTNPTPVDAAEAIFELIGPDGGNFGQWSEPVVVPAGGDSLLTVPMDVPEWFEGAGQPDAGLWRLQATLFDAEGNRLTTIPTAGLYGVTTFEETPGGYTYQGNPYSLTVTSESEEYLPGEPVNFTFHVFNHTDTQQTFLVTWGLPHHNLGWYDGVKQEITVPAQGQNSFTWQLPKVRDLDRLRSHLLLNGQSVAYVERGFWMAYPQASVTLAPSNTQYALGETPSFTLSAMNQISRDYDLTGDLVITDDKGAEQASVPVSFHLPSRGSHQTEVTLGAPLPYGNYRASIRLTALGSHVAQPVATFAVPVPRLQASLDLPVSLDQQVPVSLRLENPGAVAVPAADVALKLIGPDGQELWSGSEPFSLTAGGNRTLSFTADRGALLSLGDYRLRWEATAGGQVVSAGEKVLPARLDTELTWAQSSYRIRETARATATVHNRGVWRLTSQMHLALPDAGYQGQSAFDLPAGEQAKHDFEIILPETLSAGSHTATLSVTVGSSVERSLPLTVPPSHVTLSQDPAAVAAGDAVTVTLSNDGGVDAMTTYTATLVDSHGITVAEGSGTPTVAAGSTSAFALVIPAGAADGTYTLTVNGENQTAAVPFAFFRTLTVSGVAGTVAVDTDQDAYLRDQTVTVLGGVTVNKGSLTDGNLNLQIYSLGGSPIGSCEPGDAGATALRAAPIEQPDTGNPEKDRMVEEAMKEFALPEGSGRMSILADNSGWIGTGPAPYNPWLWYGYPHVYDTHMDAAVNYYSGRFTMGTLLGDPATPNDDYARILYGHSSPSTSYTTLRINGQDVIFGNGGRWEEAPHFDPQVPGVVSTWLYNTLRIRQIIRLVPSGTLSTARIQYQVENLSGTAQDVGVRIMLDTQLGYNDGAPFRVLGQGSITTETEFLADQVPPSFLVVDSLASPSIVTQGIIRTGDERAPDRLVIADWGNLWSYAWNYNVQPTRPITWDSGVAYYWNPVTIAPGQSIDVSTRYGVTNVSFGSGQVSTVLSAPDRLCSPAENPFWVQAFVRNNTGAVAHNVQATIALPEGLTLDPGSSAAHPLGDLRPGAETQASWLVRANGRATGNMTYSITTTSDDVQGSSAQRNINVAPSVFSTGGEQLLWERDLPVTTQATWPFSEASTTFRPGKYRAVATVTAPTGQVLDRSSALFYVAADQTLLTLATDKPVYRVGDAVTISGVVKNMTNVAGTFNLSVTAGGNPVLTESVDLAPGQEYAYTATTTADAEGPLALAASARDASLTESVTVALPQVEYEVQAPAVVGRSPFTAAVTLRNTGLLPAHLVVSVDGEQRTFDLEPGARVTDTRTLTVLQDRQIPVSITGDLTASESLTVRQGEHATVTVAPLESYVEGPVTVPFTIQNTGELPITLPLTFAVAGQTVERTYTVASGSSLSDSVTFTLTAGEHPLAWESGLEQGAGTLHVRRQVLNSLDLRADLPNRIPGTATMPVHLQNTGENRLQGRVVVALPWQTQSLPFDLAPGATADFTAALSTAGAGGPGTYPITVEAFSGEQSLARVHGDVALSQHLVITADLPAEADAGASTTITAHVTNDGDLTADTRLVMNLPGILRQQQPLNLAPGESATLTFTADLPEDLGATDLTGTLTAADARADFAFRLRGVTGSATAEWNKAYYQPGEVATLTLQADTTAVAAETVVVARVNGPGINEERYFTAGTSPAFTFQTHAGAEDQVFSYGLYLESGRSLYLNTTRLRTGNDALTVYTDQPVYRPGDTVNLTVVARDGGLLTVEGPGFREERSVNAGETSLQFTLPDDLVRGTYEIRYEMGGVEYQYPFEVNAPGVAVLDAHLNVTNGTVTTTLSVNASEPLTGVTTEWWLQTPSGQELAHERQTADMAEGRGTLVLPAQTLPTTGAGTYTLHYQVEYQGATLAQGSERFDVAGNALLGAAPQQRIYREGQNVMIDVAAIGTGPATLLLSVDGRQVTTGSVVLNGYTVTTLNAGPMLAGPHAVEVRLDDPVTGARAASEVTVQPLPTVEIRISGDQSAADWYRDAAIRLVPSEEGAEVFFRWDGAMPVRYYGQALTVIPDGTHRLETYAVIDGATGPVSSRTFAWDTTAPVIRITEPQGRDYEHDGMLTPSVVASDATAGLDGAVRVYLDGAPVSATEPIDLFNLALGNHTMRVEATDLAGNVGSAEVTFRVIATIRSTIADAQRMRRMGWIDSDAMLHSLVVKLEAAQAAVDRGQPDVAINNMESFIHEVEAQTGKALTAEAAEHLLHDAAWVIESLR